MLKKELTDKQTLMLLFICSSLIGGKGLNLVSQNLREGMIQGAAKLANDLLKVGS